MCTQSIPLRRCSVAAFQRFGALVFQRRSVAIFTFKHFYMKDVKATTNAPRIDPLMFDKVALTKLYEKHFNDSESPEEMLSDMMLEIMEGETVQKSLREYNYDFLVLTAFFSELFKPVRTPSMHT